MEQGLKDIDLLIVRYLNNEESRDDKVILDRWIHSSLENKRYFTRMVKTWEHSHIYLQDEIFADERYNRFKQLLFKRRMRRFVYSVSAIASIALLIIAIRFLIPTYTPLVSVAANDQKKEIILPDGSLVWLNKNSSIQYPENFKTSRKLYLTGEAYLDVKSNAEQPFTVETSDFTIHVLGTRFVVTDYSEEKVAEAVLESGLIQLVSQKSGEEVLLHPGQMVTYEKAKGNIRLESVDVRNFTEWINNHLVFENTPLKDVFTQLEKWYGITIKCKDTEILQTPVSFTVDTETYEEILNTLQIIAPFTWNIGLDKSERSPVIDIKNIRR